MLAQLKTCTKCKEGKSPEDFYRQNSRSTGRHPWCKACYNAYSKTKNRQETKAHRQQRNLSSRYQMTPVQLEERVAAQGGACAICRKPMRQVCVDHCHATGKVRGLLCHGCNIKLAALENPDYLKAAMEYLKAHSVPLT